ncbi:MAG: saccharopine dehydrogenase NADP-binding domain-containing protein, partial [Solirubrobacterales bacterium]|nr:saccharopine dehydrogenase NADP-binding domain-containing protein [Solirubrobacterales bacterium]
MAPVEERKYDLALFGATGFTGGLTAHYLAANAPAGLRWALVGRNRAKLEALAAELAAAEPTAPAPDLIEADAADSSALAGVAAATRVVITTVGPYALYGGPLVAACAAAGTDYVDLTGEPEFVDRMWVENHAEAERTGARIVHCCGFDSIPHDLGAYFTVKQLPEGVALTVNGYVRSNASFSGGTFASAINGFARAPKMIAAGRERRRAEPRAQGRGVHSASPGIRHDDELGGWV